MKKILYPLLALFAVAALAKTFSTFGPATGILVGSATSPNTTAATSANVIGLWTGTCNSGTFLRADGSCQSSGAGTGTTYAPTVTNIANSTAAAASDACNYINVGIIVSVSCKITYNQTANGATTRIGVSLPIASNLTAAGQLAGTSSDPSSSSSAAFGVIGDPTNDRAELDGIAVGTGGHEQDMVFMYRIL